MVSPMPRTPHSSVTRHSSKMVQCGSSRIMFRRGTGRYGTSTQMRSMFLMVRFMKILYLIRRRPQRTAIVARQPPEDADDQQSQGARKGNAQETEGGAQVAAAGLEFADERLAPDADSPGGDVEKADGGGPGRWIDYIERG